LLKAVAFAIKEQCGAVNAAANRKFVVLNERLATADAATKQLRAQVDKQQQLIGAQAKEIAALSRKLIR